MKEGAPKPKASVPEVKQTKSLKEKEVKHPLIELAELVGSSEEELEKIRDNIRKTKEKAEDNK